MSNVKLRPQDAAHLSIVKLRPHFTAGHSVGVFGLGDGCGVKGHGIYGKEAYGTGGGGVKEE
jgi:hypothetical protein